MNQSKFISLTSQNFHTAQAFQQSDTPREKKNKKKPPRPNDLLKIEWIENCFLGFECDE